MIVVVNIAIVIILLYATFMLFISVKTTTIVVATTSSLPHITIIVPCRNEESTIAHCLRSIAAQTIDPSFYEIIVVNDDSTDGTLQQLHALQSDIEFKIINSPSPGKKSAIEAGIEQAQFDIIYTIDADCTLHPHCIETMLQYYSCNKLQMLCGLVNFTKGNGLFGELQQAESAAIVGVSAVMLNNSLPATCNGANLMFSKQGFYEVGGYKKHKYLATGDDDLLMHDFFKQFGNKTTYCFHPFATVFTSPCPSFSDFLKQRSRWLTKSGSYSLPWNNILQLLVSLQLIAFYFLVSYLLVDFSWSIALVVCAKWLADGCVASRLRKVLNFNALTILIMPFYQLYIVPVILYAFTGRTDWKGRNSILSDFK